MASALPPLYDGDFSPEQKALIAGFLLHWRNTFMAGEVEVSSLAPGTATEWSIGMLKWFRSANAVTRMLLHRLGYEVEKDETYPGFSDEYDPFLSTLRRLDARGYFDTTGMD